ncbi:alpha/beta fold hydrolase [Streptomyces sp. NPDC059970]|uniref:alpha/beta fold hydrolase n=1 Tax=Streptomyces sp. NPDC059970 TaxID=3347019 RepID=UPI00369C0E41
MRPGTRVADAILRLLSRDWAGLAIALLPAAAGAWCVTLGTGWRILGGVLCAVALALALGSLRHLMHVARVRVRYPPPGRMVDVGGYRMHILAEGDAGPRPTVVWMPGGHAGGYAMYRLHALARERTRSVLVDRPGSGWSDPGPFPRTTAAEAVELLMALERAGEKGPYVFVGHSFGGLLMANAARRRPDLVAGLVLLDPTPPDVVAFGPSLPALRHAVRDQTALALRHLFGLHALVSRNEARSLEDPTQVLAVIETRTKANCAAASILRELSPDGITRDGWQTVVHDGELGSLPLFLVAPRDLTGGDKIFDAVDDPEESARVRHFFLTVRERFLAASSAARRVYTPEGTGHDFPDRVPEFVVQVVDSLLDERGPGAPDPF